MRDSKQKLVLDDIPDSVFDAWLVSRKVPGQDGVLLVPGAQRALNAENARLALYVTRRASYIFVRRCPPNARSLHV
jgi:hypothetical protein